jgi:EpsI family protein
MLVRVVALVTLLLGSAVMVGRADRPEIVPLRQSFALFPLNIGEWQGFQRPPFSEKILDVLGLDDYLTRVYSRDGRNGVDLYVGYWQSQRQGDAIHSPQNCLPGAGWEPVSQGLLAIPDPRSATAPPLEVNRYIIQKGLQRQLVLYWYQSRGRVVGNEYWSKIYLVLDAARYNRTDAALVRIMRPIDDAGPEAEAAAERDVRDFVGALMPQLGNFLPD